MTYKFATDSQTGVIEAENFADACEHLRRLVPDSAIDEDGWGWVQDLDGALFEINC